jgi:carboxyl-terminal processing protease
VRVSPRLGDEINVTLELPEALQSGLGASVEPVEDGMRVTRIRTGSAAEMAGLNSGDVIISVNGTETDGLGDEEFAALTRGDVGGEFSIVVLTTGGRQKELTLTRTYLSRPVIPVPVPGGTEMQPDPDAWVH